MNRTGAVMVALLLAGAALTACSQAAAVPSSTDPAPSGPAVDAAVQQRVKNGCMDQLRAQVSGTTPEPGRLHPQKVKLTKVAFVGEITAIELPGAAPGYELGIEFVYKLGNDDPRTGRKLCRINLADSSVVWQPLK